MHEEEKGMGDNPETGAQPYAHGPSASVANCGVSGEVLEVGRGLSLRC